MVGQFAMRIATYNVNGINGRLANLLGWLEEAGPDIVCLQELKSPDGGRRVVLDAFGPGVDIGEADLDSSSARCSTSAPPAESGTRS
jgi:hypothetical protein